MQVRAIKTPIVKLNDNLLEIIANNVPTLVEPSIIAVTSKIISLSQARVVKQGTIEKYDLITQEAEHIYAKTRNPYDLYITLKDGILIPSAGIDECNIEGYYILLPSEVQNTASQICKMLRERDGHQQIGVIITDSTITPKRQGVTGIAIGWAGFQPNYSYIGKNDLVGKPLKVTKINLIDALAASAALVMGEGNECTPLAIIENAPKMEFISHLPQDLEEVLMPDDQDLFSACFSKV